MFIYPLFEGPALFKIGPIALPFYGLMYVVSSLIFVACQSRLTSLELTQESVWFQIRVFASKLPLASWKQRMLDLLRENN